VPAKVRAELKTGTIFITPVIYPDVAFGGLIASHGRPHVATVSFSDRKAKLDEKIYATILLHFSIFYHLADNPRS
jgi:hypothetical protein